MEKEFTVLYTHQKQKKAKTWHDGVVKHSGYGNKAVLFDDKGGRVDSIYIRVQDLTVGEQIESDRFLILIEDLKTAGPTPEEAVAAPKVQMVPQRPQTQARCAGLQKKRSGFVPPRMVKQPISDTEDNSNPSFLNSNPTVTASVVTYSQGRGMGPTFNQSYSQGAQDRVCSETATPSFSNRSPANMAAGSSRIHENMLNMYKQFGKSDSDGGSVTSSQGSNCDDGVKIRSPWSVYGSNRSSPSLSQSPNVLYTEGETSSRSPVFPINRTMSLPKTQQEHRINVEGNISTKSSNLMQNKTEDKRNVIDDNNDVCLKIQLQLKQKRNRNQIMNLLKRKTGSQSTDKVIVSKRAMEGPSALPDEKVFANNFDKQENKTAMDKENIKSDMSQVQCKRDNSFEESLHHELTDMCKSLPQKSIDGFEGVCNNLKKTDAQETDVISPTSVKDKHMPYFEAASHISFSMSSDDTANNMENKRYETKSLTETENKSKEPTDKEDKAEDDKMNDYIMEDDKADDYIMEDNKADDYIMEDNKADDYIVEDDTLDDLIAKDDKPNDCIAGDDKADDNRAEDDKSDDNKVDDYIIKDDRADDYKGKYDKVNDNKVDNYKVDDDKADDYKGNNYTMNDIKVDDNKVDDDKVDDNKVDDDKVEDDKVEDDKVEYEEELNDSFGCFSLVLSPPDPAVDNESNGGVARGCPDVDIDKHENAEHSGSEINGKYLEQQKISQSPGVGDNLQSIDQSEHNFLEIETPWTKPTFEKLDHCSKDSDCQDRSCMKALQEMKRSSDKISKDTLSESPVVRNIPLTCQLDETTASCEQHVEHLVRSSSELKVAMKGPDIKAKDESSAMRSKLSMLDSPRDGYATSFNSQNDVFISIGGENVVKGTFHHITSNDKDPTITKYNVDDTQTEKDVGVQKVEIESHDREKPHIDMHPIMDLESFDEDSQEDIDNECFKDADSVNHSREVSSLEDCGNQVAEQECAFESAPDLRAYTSGPVQIVEEVDSQATCMTQDTMEFSCETLSDCSQVVAEPEGYPVRKATILCEVVNESTSTRKSNINTARAVRDSHNDFNNMHTKADIGELCSFSPDSDELQKYEVPEHRVMSAGYTHKAEQLYSGHSMRSKPLHGIEYQENASTEYFDDCFEEENPLCPFPVPTENSRPPMLGNRFNTWQTVGCAGDNTGWQGEVTDAEKQQDISAFIQSRLRGFEAGGIVRSLPARKPPNDDSSHLRASHAGLLQGSSSYISNNLDFSMSPSPRYGTIGESASSCEGHTQAVSDSPIQLRLGPAGPAFLPSVNPVRPETRVHKFLTSGIGTSISSQESSQDDGDEVYERVYRARPMHKDACRGTQLGQFSHSPNVGQFPQSPDVRQFSHSPDVGQFPQSPDILINNTSSTDNARLSGTGNSPAQVANSHVKRSNSYDTEINFSETFNFVKQLKDKETVKLTGRDQFKMEDKTVNGLLMGHNKCCSDKPATGEKFECYKPSDKSKSLTGGTSDNSQASSCDKATQGVGGHLTSSKWGEYMSDASDENDLDITKYQDNSNMNRDYSVLEKPAELLAKLAAVKSVQELQEVEDKGKVITTNNTEDVCMTVSTNEEHSKTLDCLAMKDIQVSQSADCDFPNSFASTDSFDDFVANENVYLSPSSERLTSCMQPEQDILKGNENDIEDLRNAPDIFHEMEESNTCDSVIGNLEDTDNTQDDKNYNLPNCKDESDWKKGETKIPAEIEDDSVDDKEIDGHQDLHDSLELSSPEFDRTPSSSGRSSNCSMPPSSSLTTNIGHSAGQVEKVENKLANKVEGVTNTGKNSRCIQLLSKIKFGQGTRSCDFKMKTNDHVNLSSGLSSPNLDVAAIVNDMNDNHHDKFMPNMTNLSGSSSDSRFQNNSKEEPSCMVLDGVSLGPVGNSVETVSPTYLDLVQKTSVSKTRPVFTPCSVNKRFKAPTLMVPTKIREQRATSIAAVSPTIYNRSDKENIPSTNTQGVSSTQLHFPCRALVDQLQNVLRQVVIPERFPSVNLYKQVLISALTEYVNTQLLEVAKRYHRALGKVDTSGYSQGSVTMGATAATATPACLCGAQSKMVMVKKQGVNQGRYFYACSADRNQQCKFFQWADDSSSKGGYSKSSSSKRVIRDSKSLSLFMKDNGVHFYGESQLCVRTKENISRYLKAPKWVRARGDPELMQKKQTILKIPYKGHSSLYAKDDLWIVSKSLDFDAGSTFIAKSTFHGPTAGQEVQIEPLVGYSPSNWPAESVCHAILAGNASSELSCIDNIREHLQPTSPPIASQLLNRRSTETEQDRDTAGRYVMPRMVTSNKGNTFLPSQHMDDLARDFIERYHLNTDQAEAVRRVAGMFSTEKTHQLDDILLIHGVFGAGKSYLLSVVVLFLVAVFGHMDQVSTPDSVQWKLLISSTTNVAVDRILNGLLELGFEEFVRVGSVKKIAKSVLPYSVHATGTDSQELRDLQEMLRSGELTASEKSNVRKSIEKHRCGENKKMLSKVKVVGATCAACSLSCLNNMTFPLVLLDESSQMTEPTSLLPIARFSCQKLLLVGDPKQLAPTIQSVDSAHGQGLEQTMFDRLLKMGHLPTLLRTQYRCHPYISALANKLFYGGMLEDGVQEADRQPLVPFLPTVCLYTVERGRENCERVGSYYNEEEAQFVVFLLRVLLAAGLEPATLGVITLYRSQVARITDLLTIGGDDGSMKGVQVSTVDAFQGGEKDVIILSTVKTNNCGFIDSDKRMNVALTRARHHLCIVGHHGNLSTSMLWGKVIEHCNAFENGVQSSEEVRKVLEQCMETMVNRDTADPCNSGSIQASGSTQCSEGSTRQGRKRGKKRKTPTQGTPNNQNSDISQGSNSKAVKRRKVPGLEETARTGHDIPEANDGTSQTAEEDEVEGMVISSVELSGNTEPYQPSGTGCQGMLDTATNLSDNELSDTDLPVFSCGNKD